MKKTNRISTGYNPLDTIAGGIGVGEITVLAGRTAIGKTSLEMKIAGNLLVENNIPVAIISMAENRSKITERMIFEIYRCIGIKKDLNQYELYVNDTTGISATEIACEVEKLREKYLDRPLVIFVDFVQLIGAEPGTKETDRAMQLRGSLSILSKMAKEYNAAVVLLSQVSRACETRVFSKPNIADLWQINQDLDMMDLVCLLYRRTHCNECEIHAGSLEMDIIRYPKKQ